MTSADPAPQPEQHDHPVVCCDLDGVIWRGEVAIPGAAAGVTALRDAGLRVGFFSNNSSLPIDAVVAKLAHCGIDASPGDVLTSATAAAALLSSTLPTSSRVLVCGGPGISEALTAVGLEAVSAAGNGPDTEHYAAVVVGIDRDFGYDALTRASDVIRGGARFLATNVDATYPIPGGFLPGAGAIVAAVAIAAGAVPEIAGKPYPAAATLVHERFGSHGVMVGDRPSTDGAFADTLGWPFALVLSGVATRHPTPGGEPVPEPPPPYVADDLGSLAPLLVSTLT